MEMLMSTWNLVILCPSHCLCPKSLHGSRVQFAPFWEYRELNPAPKLHPLPFYKFLRQGLTKLSSCSGWAQTGNLSASASHNAGVTGVFHYTSLTLSFQHFSEESPLVLYFFTLYLAYSSLGFTPQTNHWNCDQAHQWYLYCQISE